ncbi:pirin family protein [Legionella nagasakiensis]|uniref:pirin family protein n=1 Tax=Legionella nagasakiensis TaxID=535290 RepID=UPI001054757B|nr:pirin family protein [Legionella nagasakiensis]
MIKAYPYTTLGSADYGWLNTHYHFSFADYYNPKRMGFGNLRVINDDTIKPGTGFPTHPHKDMEIITYVTQGAITHRDSQGNEGRTEAGNIQVMTAGSGIHHSEYNLETIETKLFQIWIKPRVKNLEPRWEIHLFPKDKSKNNLQLLVSGNGDAPLTINQDAKIYAGNFTAHNQITHTLDGKAYLIVIEGHLTADEISLSQGDGAEITDTDAVTLTPSTDTKLLLIEI